MSSEELVDEINVAVSKLNGLLDEAANKKLTVSGKIQNLGTRYESEDILWVSIKVYEQIKIGERQGSAGATNSSSF